MHDFEDRFLLHKRSESNNATLYYFAVCGNMEQLTLGKLWALWFSLVVQIS